MAEFRPRRPVFHFLPIGANCRTTFSALALLLLAGCSKAGQNEGQVAARVNADEIPVSQVASAVARLPDATPERLEKARRETLDMLVDQQLAAQMAVKQGLEHDPDVVSRLDAARREILARTYVKRVVAQLPAPTDSEVRSYYDEHPLLYAQRRYYVLREIALPPNDAPVEELRTMIGKDSVDRIAAWLRARGATYSVSASQRPAEEIPADVLDALSHIPPGATTMVSTADGVFVVHLVGSSEAPLQIDAVTQRIRRQLAEDRARAAVVRDIAQIREHAHIEYRNEFAEAGSQNLPIPPPGAGVRSRPLLVDEPIAGH